MNDSLGGADDGSGGLGLPRFAHENRRRARNDIECFHGPFVVVRIRVDRVGRDFALVDLEGAIRISRGNFETHEAPMAPISGASSQSGIPDIPAEGPEIS